MEHVLPSANFPSRFARLIAKFRSKSYRDSYVRSHTRQFLARQIRAFRGNRSQKEFAKVLGVSQSVVSERLEDPNYGKWNLQTLFDIAAKLNVAVLVRFVDFETFLKSTADTSEDAAHPAEYNEELMDGALRRHERDMGQSALKEFFIEWSQESPSLGAQGLAVLPAQDNKANAEPFPQLAGIQR